MPKTLSILLLLALPFAALRSTPKIPRGSFGARKLTTANMFTPIANRLRVRLTEFTSITILLLLAMSRVVFAGESSLTITYQPLDGLGSGEIKICQVTCHDWYSHSGQATAIGLISAPNVPPTNNPKDATQNLNLASVCGVSFFSSDIGDPSAALELTLDATKFVIPEPFGHPRENIIRSCLECLRRCLPEKLRKTPVKLDAADSDKEWMGKIVREFNKHDRRKVFYRPPQ